LLTGTTSAKVSLIEKLKIKNRTKSQRKTRIFHMKTLHLTIAVGILLAAATSAPAQAFTNLHNFIFTNGTTPVATLIVSGNTLYGTASDYGGGNGGGSGSVFRMDTDGSSFTNLHTFSAGTDGGKPVGSLVLAGNTLYGAASFGGASNYGCLFAINTDGTGLTNIYNFSKLVYGGPTFGTNADGAYPQCGLILSGNTLYATALEGGTIEWGTLFAVKTNGSAFTNMHNFGLADGQYPQNLLLAGNTLYGATAGGGSNNYGTIFKMNTNGTGFTNLYSFSRKSVGTSPATNDDGAFPNSDLILSGNTLFGTATEGGYFGNGTVFKINTDGSGFAVLHHFSATNAATDVNGDGFDPRSGLILFSNALYGTAYYGGSAGNGTVFSVNTDGSGFTTLYNFSATNNLAGTNLDGAHPVGGLLLSGDSLYGTTSKGGTAAYGTIFSILFPPPLYITRSGTNVILTWPTNATGFNLQSTTNLISPVWIGVSGQYAVTNPIVGTQKFYRLKHP
jgi:uncharacterized repeat protein (TIGR03803 family)